VFEKRIAALEGGATAISVASGKYIYIYIYLRYSWFWIGVAAQFAALTAICSGGDHIIASTSLYAGTFAQLKYTFSRFGIDVSFVRPNDPENFRKAIQENTRAIYIESIGNPELIVPDFRAISDIAHEAGIPLVVDK
jgi:O-acetylhomoserine/O-acetylserine sulfhydrylase-like pyridoxal-dependent enzyme